jgi:hypothetical protein
MKRRTRSDQEQNEAGPRPMPRRVAPVRPVEPSRPDAAPVRRMAPLQRTETEAGSVARRMRAISK